MRTNLEYADTIPASGTWADGGPRDPARCPVLVTVSDRLTSWHQCSNKPKPGAVRPVRPSRGGDDVDMEVCGLHASAYDRAASKESDHRSRSERARVAREEANARAKRISELLADMPVAVETSSDHRTFITKPTGRVLIDAKELLELLEWRESMS